MQKILNNCIVSKCSECPNKVMSMSHNSVSCSVKPLDAMLCSFVNPDSIDQSCPLAECKIVKIDGDGNYEVKSELLIDYMIIVAKRGE